MRERLRQLLSKKKAKICKVTQNPATKNSVDGSPSSTSLSSTSSTSSTITNADAPNPALRSNASTTSNFNNPAVASKTVIASNRTVPTIPIKAKEDHWNIEAAVEFIEGGQGGKKDLKKAEKKARQKQKKVPFFQPNYF